MLGSEPVNRRLLPHLAVLVSIYQINKRLASRDVPPGFRLSRNVNDNKRLEILEGIHVAESPFDFSPVRRFPALPEYLAATRWFTAN